jgi:hypothetical protein
MNDLVVVEKIAGWEKLKALVLDSVSLPITKRVYNMARDEFLIWFQQAPRPGFTKVTESAWRVSLEALTGGQRRHGYAQEEGFLAKAMSADSVPERTESNRDPHVWGKVTGCVATRCPRELVVATDVRRRVGSRGRPQMELIIGSGPALSK